MTAKKLKIVAAVAALDKPRRQARAARVRADRQVKAWRQAIRDRAEAKQKKGEQ